MPPPSNLGPSQDFLQAISASIQSPSVGGEGRDLPDGFPSPVMQGHRTIDAAQEEGIDGANAYDYEVHRGVFLVYRPWTACNRCAQMLASQKISLPEDEGDLTCPHTQVREYKTIVDRGLAGLLILGTEQETTQRDGTIVISMKWFEAKINYKRQRALKKKLEREVATQTSEDIEESDG